MDIRVPLVVACCALAPTAAAAQSPTLADCAARVGRDAKDPGAVTCYLAVGRARTGGWDAVARHIQERLAGSPGDADALFVLGRVRATQGLDEAAGLLRAAADGYGRRSNALGQVLALTSLAAFIGQQRQPAEAQPAIEEARAIATASGSPRLEAWVDAEEAWTAYRAADYGRALRSLAASREVVALTDDDQLRTTWMSAHGATLWALNRAREAIAQYEEEAAFHASRGNTYDQAAARVNVALLWTGARRREHALEAARLARASGNLSVESSAYFYLSGTSAGAEARAFAQRSLDVALASRHPATINRARTALALATLPLDPGLAFRQIDEAIAEAGGVGDRNQAARARFTKATMRWSSGSRDEAIEASLSLLDSIEAIRNLQPEAEIQAARFAAWRWAYYRLAGHLLAGHHAPSGVPNDDERALAFATVERMRARIVLDRLDAAGATLRPGDPTARDNYDRLLARAADLTASLRSLPNDHPDRLERARALERLEREATEVSAHLTGATGASSPTEPGALLSELQAGLAADEAFLSYQVADLGNVNGVPFGAWVWTITRDRIDVSPLQATGISSVVDVFLGLLDRRDGSDAAGAARLYQDYVAPALEGLPSGISRLIIVPDDALHRVPFDALRATTDGPWLGSRFEITVAASAALWLRWRRVPAGPGDAVLVLADPAIAHAGSTDAAERSVADGLGRLREARHEARAIRRTLGGRSHVFEAESATESRVKAASFDRYRLLHFAAHAVVDDIHPERSAVLLAPDENDDGLLQVREIAELPLSGQVVLLSACRSAGGAVVSGEGPLSLAHGFFRAGARTVVASLWPIRDREARDAFSAIAAGLAAGQSVAGAVATVRRDLDARGAPPAAWAGLVVLGDGGHVPYPGGLPPAAPPWWLMGAAGCAVMGVVAWGALRRRARRTS